MKINKWDTGIVFPFWDIGGEVVKEDERYQVRDNQILKNLSITSTRLNSSCSTTGHFHEGQEEIYFFIEGDGTMEVGEKKFHFNVNDIVTIPDGEFHRVHANKSGCYFVCVFNGVRNE
ncbi:MAG: cupin domain-containing protein [Candidatus Poseidoniales archaeon]